MLIYHYVSPFKLREKKTSNYPSPRLTKALLQQGCLFIFTSIHHGTQYGELAHLRSKIGWNTLHSHSDWLIMFEHWPCKFCNGLIQTKICRKQGRTTPQTNKMGPIARMDKMHKGGWVKIVPVKIWFCCNVKPNLTKNHGSLRFPWILTRAQMNFRGNELKSKSEKYEKCCCCDGLSCHFEEKLLTGHFVSLMQTYANMLHHKDQPQLETQKSLLFHHWCIPWISEAEK